MSNNKYSTNQTSIANEERGYFKKFGLDFSFGKNKRMLALKFLTLVLNKNVFTVKFF